MHHLFNEMVSGLGIDTEGAVGIRAENETQRRNDLDGNFTLDALHRALQHGQADGLLNVQRVSQPQSANPTNGRMTTVSSLSGLLAKEGHVL